MDIFRFRKIALNNGIASGQKAMPLKDSTSDGTASFSLDRHHYSDALNVQTVAEIQRKKWMGGNRDASQVVANRRVASMGVGSLNASGNSMNFVSNTNRSTIDQALARVRGGGYMVPPKVSKKYLATAVPDYIYVNPGLGPIYLADAYAYDPYGVLLGSGKTDGTGLAKINFSESYEGTMILEIVGNNQAYYYDEKLNTIRNFTSAESLLVIIPSKIKGFRYSANIITHMAAAKLADDMGLSSITVGNIQAALRNFRDNGVGFDTEQAFSNAISAVKRYLGLSNSFDILRSHTFTSSLLNVNSDETLYGYVLHQLTANTNASNGVAQFKRIAGDIFEDATQAIANAASTVTSVKTAVASGDYAVNFATADSSALTTSTALSVLSADQIGNVPNSTLTAKTMAKVTIVQAAGLTFTQISSLSSPALGAISTDAVKGIPATSFSNTQLAALTTAQVKSLTTAQVSVLTGTQVQAITTAQLKSLTTAQVSALTGAQVQAITTAQIQSLTTAQVSVLTSAQLQAITTAQLKSLTTAQVSALTGAQVETVTPAQVAALTTSQIQSLTTAQISALTGTQVETVTPTQVAALTNPQLQSLTTTQVAVLATSSIAALTTSQASALTTSQLVSLSTSQIQAFETTIIAALTTAQVKSFTSTQLQAATNTQVQAFTTSQVQSLTTSQIQSFTTSNIAALASAQVRSFTSAQVAALTTTQVAALTTAQIPSLTSSQTEALTTAQVRVLTTTQIRAFTGPQIANFTTDALNDFISTQDTFTPPKYQIINFTRTQLQNITTEQQNSVTDATLYNRLMGAINPPP